MVTRLPELDELLHGRTTYLYALLGILSILFLKKFFVRGVDEGPVSFVWDRPAEASPSWKGRVLTKPYLHGDPERPEAVAAFDPSTGYHIASFPSPTPQDMHDMVTKAEKASQEWSKTSFAQRRKVLRSLLAWCIRDKEAIAQVCCRDTGKTMLDAAFGEILTTCEKIRWMLDFGEHYLKPEWRPTSWLLAHKVSYVHYEPLGVVGAIVSWNYPFHNLLSPVLAALMSGNAIVIKTSEQVAWSSSHFAEALRSCLAACGHDPNIVQVAIGCEGEAAAAFTRDERLGHLTFIGSDHVGKMVARNAAEGLTPVTLELGGKDPLVLLASADIPFFKDTFMKAVFTGSGQGCIATERFICQTDVYDEFISTMKPRVGELRPGRDTGAMINGDRLKRLEDMVASAVQQGAKLFVGGTRFDHPNYPQAFYFAPTLLCDVTMDMEIAQEECFAPIMLVFRAQTTDECIRIANSSRYALGGAVFGRSKAECRYVAKRLVCGMVSINDFGTFYLNQSLPFGGSKSSGYLRFGGPEGLRSLCNAKAIMEDRLHGIIQTPIPPLLRFPVLAPKSSWRFVDGLIDTIYHPTWSGMLRGVWRLATAKQVEQ